MIPRQAEPIVRRLAAGFPIVAITGPRQSGKTTLARALFPDRPYVSLEDPEQRAFAMEDPRGFLARYAAGAVIDEAHRAVAEPLGTGERLRGFACHGARVALRTGNERSRAAPAAALPQLRQTPGEDAEAVFSRRRLAAWLLGIRDAAALNVHASRGALFETWAVAEYVKHRFNAGQPADAYFWRDHVGREIDLLFESAGQLQAIEMKSGATFVPEWIEAVRTWLGYAGDAARPPCIVYGGDASMTRDGVRLIGWRDWLRDPG
ncbi:MAG: DUF4143 domain-containing protein [Pseudomonadales bacterium]|nr:DUF4143 domain-containing protein [Pseudomonadales bacterium]